MFLMLSAPRGKRRSVILNTRWFTTSNSTKFATTNMVMVMDMGTTER